MCDRLAPCAWTCSAGTRHARYESRVAYRFTGVHPYHRTEYQVIKYPQQQVNSNGSHRSPGTRACDTGTRTVMTRNTQTNLTEYSNSNSNSNTDTPGTVPGNRTTATTGTGRVEHWEHTDTTTGDDDDDLAETVDTYVHDLVDPGDGHEDHHRLITAIIDLQQQLDLPQPATATTVTIINQLTHDDDWVYVRGYETATAAAVMIACKKHDTPRHRDEIAAVTGTDGPTLSRERRKIEKQTGHHYLPVTADAWVTRYATELGLEHLTSTAITAIETCREHKPSAAPRSLAAGGLWCAINTDGDENAVTQTHLVETMDTTGVTLRSVTPHLINEQYRAGAGTGDEQ